MTEIVGDVTDSAVLLFPKADNGSWCYGRSSDLFPEAGAFPRRFPEWHSWPYPIAELTAAGTVADLHRIPF